MLSLDDAFARIICMCLTQWQLFEILSPRCFCELTSLIGLPFKYIVGWLVGCLLEEKSRLSVLEGSQIIKSPQLLILSTSWLILLLVRMGLSTNMNEVALSAKRRIFDCVSWTISLM